MNLAGIAQRLEPHLPDGMYVQLQQSSAYTVSCSVMTMFYTRNGRQPRGVVGFFLNSDGGFEIQKPRFDRTVEYAKSDNNNSEGHSKTSKILVSTLDRKMAKYFTKQGMHRMTAAERNKFGLNR